MGRRVLTEQALPGRVPCCSRHTKEAKRREGPLVCTEILGSELFAILAAWVGEKKREKIFF